jgi:hypothetical protein
MQVLASCYLGTQSFDTGSETRLVMTVKSPCYEMLVFIVVDGGCSPMDPHVLCSLT